MKPHFYVLVVSLVVSATLAMSMTAAAQGRYAIRQSNDIVELHDSQAKIRVSVLKTMNNAYEMVVNGQDVIRKTFATLDDFRARPGLSGIPLLWPYANRLDEQAFYANGQKYSFDTGLGNTGSDAIPIHGFVRNAVEWRLVEAKANATGATVTGRLDFYRNPRYMKQFPFAHTVTITYRLFDGMLEVRARLDNMSNEPMPVALGFHPYFQLTDSDRDEWRLSIGAKTHWRLDDRTIPTGETQPITDILPDPKNVAVSDVRLDDIFSDLERDAEGRSLVSLIGKRQRLDVLLGRKYKTVLILVQPPRDQPGRGAGGAAAPILAAQQRRGTVAIEPMAGITNSMNLAHRGLYHELQSVPPGGAWEESFWLRPSGF